MPDIWTSYPEIVRDLLKGGGLKCGVEPRILEGRDPNWTCIVDGKSISGDLYIHHLDEIKNLPASAAEPQGWSIVGGWESIALGGLLAVVVGQAWIIKKLRRQVPSS